MNDNSLQITIRNAFYRCIHVMSRKSREYSPGEDRLENFKEAGRNARSIVLRPEGLRAVILGLARGKPGRQT